jgi:hypothetical protein
MSDAPDKDFLEEEVESGLASLRAMGLSAEALAEAENLLRLALTAHPTGRDLVRRARPRVVQESGPTPVESVENANGARVRAMRSR